jgi:hypothetical protein
VREALRRSRRPQSRVSGSKSMPSPVGGWNARDSLAAMAETDAVYLNNWFPGTSYCEMRGGYTETATGMTGNCKTLAVYNGLTGTNSMWGLTSSGIYNVTSTGAVGASVLARTNGKHQWVNFGDGTNNYLILVNGVDKPAYYNGAAWVAVDGASAPALTGLTTTNIISVFASKGRLYFIEKDTLNFWYLAAGAAGGALTKFDLSGVATRGGFLMAGATWTIDGGDGPDDRVVFVTSEGEVVVYQGTNPSNAAAWSLVGTYYLGKPLGRRCLERYGGDLILITQNGTFALSTAIQSASIDYKTALSYKIQNAFNEASLLYGATFGWEAKLFPAKSAILVNIPVAEDGTHYQYVMNTITKSWCKFDGWDAEDFVVFNKKLYFCKATSVYEAWTGTSDGNNRLSPTGFNNITCKAKQAFNYFGSTGMEKLFMLLQPVLSVTDSVAVSTGVDVDFQETDFVGLVAVTNPASSLWGTALWDSGIWASDYNTVEGWTSPSARAGKCFAVKLMVVSNTVNVRWLSSNTIYETGGPL